MYNEELINAILIRILFIIIRCDGFIAQLIDNGQSCCLSTCNQLALHRMFAMNWAINYYRMTVFRHVSHKIFERMGGKKKIYENEKRRKESTSCNNKRGDLLPFNSMNDANLLYLLINKWWHNSQMSALCTIILFCDGIFIQ